MTPIEQAASDFVQLLDRSLSPEGTHPNQESEWTLQMTLHGDGDAIDDFFTTLNNLRDSLVDAGHLPEL